MQSVQRRPKIGPSQGAKVSPQTLLSSFHPSRSYQTPHSCILSCSRGGKIRGNTPFRSTYKTADRQGRIACESLAAIVIHSLVLALFHISTSQFLYHYCLCLFCFIGLVCNHYSDYRLNSSLSCALFPPKFFPSFIC